MSPVPDPVQRLAPSTTSADLRDGLEARVHDGLLLLGRQWQFGEHVADDAGSPATAELAVEQAALGAYQPGEGGFTAYDPLTQPLEPLVESEPAAPAQARDWGLLIEAATQFLRQLDAHGAADCRSAYRTHYALTGPTAAEATELDDESRATLAFLAGRLPDPRRLSADLRAALGPLGDGPGALPTVPELPASQRAAATRAARAWLRWHAEQGRDQPPAGDGLASSWRSDRMEYTFGAAARRGDTGQSLRVPEYAAGRLDWPAFRLGAPVPGDGLPPTRVVSTRPVPAPVVFRGMPADRFWQFEDARVSWDAMTVDLSSVATAVLLEFALIQSNDWFALPVELDVGSLARVRTLIVTDTFGERQRLMHASAVDGAAAPWRMFTLDPDTGGARDDALFLLPPTLGGALSGEPIEDVMLLRDEQANLAWAVERLVERPAGGVLDRYEEYQRRLSDLPAPVPAAEDLPRYRLGSDVPDYWIPLVPHQTDPSVPATLLRRAVIARPDMPAGLAGRLLEAAGPFVLRDEEVPREGAHVTRSYRYARWTDGSTHLWVSRRKQPGRGEGSSGLRFDWLE
jgi:hypothetical protein